jgi:adenylate cyclase
MAGATCIACGQANPDGAKFCNECGTPLARAAGHEVRKTLTVLFADLVGFTSLGERSIRSPCGA